MREEGCDLQRGARCTDISLHGCHMEAQAIYAVRTVLHLKLEANGLRVEAQGNVGGSYPYLGMGIAFVEMSGQDRARLKELLDTISRPSMIMGPGINSALPVRASGCRALDLRRQSSQSGSGRVLREPPQAHAGKSF
jgi:hypothetical protein